MRACWRGIVAVAPPTTHVEILACPGPPEIKAMQPFNLAARRRSEAVRKLLVRKDAALLVAHPEMLLLILEARAHTMWAAVALAVAADVVAAADPHAHLLVRHEARLVAAA
eukprot:CAMPEP_0179321016 /NCGR_PEP_ID=MMETSP0797-20121207/58381_1 /TAXON_ID=47934 /ORGANISM="Dinophysis acuminata, Strain DAEP01" /LENGTH=110 /DNA_ID=CAMNT_0021032601 /DNA_START=172 /DNA_END=504 /DNA_ORIENTATION=-